MFLQLNQSSFIIGNILKYISDYFLLSWETLRIQYDLKEQWDRIQDPPQSS